MNLTFHPQYHQHRLPSNASEFQLPTEIFQGCSLLKHTTVNIGRLCVFSALWQILRIRRIHKFQSHR